MRLGTGIQAEERPSGGSRGFRALPILLGLGLAFGPGGCGEGDWVPVPDSEGALKSSGEVRGALRLYDGAPPVIPHAELGARCVSCHDTQGLAVDGVGYAPPSPHDATEEEGATSRCRQCHVPVLTDDLFSASGFVGLSQDLRPGSRLYPGAPPTIPHKILMRENCAACHQGPGARAQIVTSHPERVRCRQCHVPVTTREGVLNYAESGLGTPEGI